MAEGGNARKKVSLSLLRSIGSQVPFTHQGIVLCKPIVYGNVARYFGKKRDDDGHTHTWTCYLRPFKNEVLCSSYSLYTRRFLAMAALLTSILLLLQWTCGDVTGVCVISFL